MQIQQNTKILIFRFQIISEQQLRDAFEKSSLDEANQVSILLIELSRQDIQQLFHFLVKQLTLQDYSLKQCIKYYSIIMLNLIMSILEQENQDLRQLYEKVVEQKITFQKYIEGIITLIQKSQLNIQDCKENIILQQLIQQQKKGIELENINNRIFLEIQQQMIKNPYITQQMLQQEEYCEKCRYMVSAPHLCQNKVKNSNTAKYNRIQYENFDDYIKQIKQNGKQFIE